MNRELKHLVLRIASLPKRDQRWMLQQLNAQQTQSFTQYNGIALLKNAQRFATLPILEQSTQTATALPDFCQDLMKKPPLYVALILEQGVFPWEQRFITQYRVMHPDYILPKVLSQKTATKHALFNQWRSTLSFTEQLEIEHGTTN